jgi:hypothetical protein
MTLFHGVHPKKISVPALILTLLCSAVAGTLPVRLAAADPISMKSYYNYYSFSSPQNATYYTTTVSLAFTVNTMTAGEDHPPFTSHYKYFYILDGQENLRVDDARVDLVPVKETAHVVYSTVYDTYTDWILEFNVTLSSLGEGSHSVIYGNAPPAGGGWDNPYISELMSGAIFFSVENRAPQVSIVSPDSGVYDGLGMLSFRVNEAVSWVGYSLDGGANVTVGGNVLRERFLDGDLLFLEGNLTLAGLSAGTHSLSVYAKDLDGKTGVSSCVFVVGQEDREALESFPTTLVAVAVIASAAVVCFGLVAYLLKRKRRNAA